MQGASLHLAARIVRLEGGFGTACKAALLLIFSFFLNLAWSLARINDPLVAIALNLVLGLVISAFAVKLVYGSTFWHALAVYVVASLIQIAVAALLVLVIVIAVAGLGGSEAGEEFLQELRERWEEVQRQGLDSVPSPFGGPSDDGAPKVPPDDAQATLVPWPPARAGEQVGRKVQAFLVDGREISGTLQAVHGDTSSTLGKNDPVVLSKNDPPDKIRQGHSGRSPFLLCPPLGRSDFGGAEGQSRPPEAPKGSLDGPSAPPQNRRPRGGNLAPGQGYRGGHFWRAEQGHFWRALKDTLTIAQQVTGGTIFRQVRMGEIRELRVLIFH